MIFIPYMKKKLFEHVNGNQFKIISSKKLLKESTFETTIPKMDDNDPRFAPGQNEIPIELEYDETGSSRGARGSYGEPIEPDEPGDIDIGQAINTLTGQVVELTDDEKTNIEQELWEYLANQGPDEPDYPEPDNYDFR